MLILLPHDFTGKWYIIDGVAYRRSGWLGCQLESWQFTHPKQNELRLLKHHDFLNKQGFEIELASSRRELLRVRCTWRLTHCFNTMDQYVERIKKLYSDIERI